MHQKKNGLTTLVLIATLCGLTLTIACNDGANPPDGDGSGSGQDAGPVATDSDNPRDDTGRDGGTQTSDASTPDDIDPLPSICGEGCPDGQVCDPDAGCVTTDGCAKNGCPDGLTCIDDSCVTVACSDCAVNETCVDGVCMPGTQCAEGCPDGKRCFENLCVDPGGCIINGCNDADIYTCDADPDSPTYDTCIRECTDRCGDGTACNYDTGQCDPTATV
jgi:hypothetical protein